MKKYIPLIFVVLFPYVPMILMINGDSSGTVVLVSTTIMYFAALAASALYFTGAVCGKQKSENLALANMVVKIIHIPAYVLAFAVGASGVLFIQFIAITFFMFLFDCFTILLSGIVAFSAVVRARAENKLSTGYMLLFGISSFVFCIDLIFAVILYAKTKNRRKTEGFLLNTTRTFEK